MHRPELAREGESDGEGFRVRIWGRLKLLRLRCSGVFVKITYAHDCSVDAAFVVVSGYSELFLFIFVTVTSDRHHVFVLLFFVFVTDGIFIICTVSNIDSLATRIDTIVPMHWRFTLSAQRAARRRLAVAVKYVSVDILFIDINTFNFALTTQYCSTLIVVGFINYEWIISGGPLSMCLLFLLCLRRRLINILNTNCLPVNCVTIDVILVFFFILQVKRIISCRRPRFPQLLRLFT